MSSPTPQTSPAPVTSPPSPPTLPAVPPPPLLVGQSNNNKTTLIALGVGIGIGGTIVLFFVGIFVIWYKRRKRRLALSEMYATTYNYPQGPKYDLGGPLQHWQHIAPSSKQNMVGLLSKPSPPPGIASNPQLFSMGSSTPPPPLSTSSGSEKLLPQSSANMGYGFSKTIFTYEDLALATEGFSSANLLGQGGFGYVHKGVLANGTEVAIKQLKIGSGQGEREFQAEVEIISRVHHKHLVSLVGYCISGPQRLLVYEFLPNNTLEFHLHGKGHIPINWDTRMKVSLGSAKGLAYLHEDCQPKIIHCDIKAANILLDSNFEPKVADFGLARFNSDTDTHVSTRVMGTFGYLAPEYALTGKLTDKSDVFSFGVMLLELITGRRPIDNGQFLDDNIVDWARPLLTQAMEDGNFDTLADTRLQKDYDSNEMFRMIACAAVCVRHLARRRPRMSQIARALEGNMPLEDLNEGIRPGHSTIYGSHGSSDYDTAQYREDLKKFKKMAFESQGENNSSAWSGPTSNLGQQTSGSSSEGLRTTHDPGSSIGGQQPQTNQEDADRIYKNTAESS